MKSELLKKFDEKLAELHTLRAEIEIALRQSDEDFRFQMIAANRLRVSDMSKKETAEYLGIPIGSLENQRRGTECLHKNGKYYQGNKPQFVRAVVERHKEFQRAGGCNGKCLEEPKNVFSKAG
jgi:hypothetical protein